MEISIPKIILYADIKYIDNFIIELAEYIKKGYTILTIEPVHNIAKSIASNISIQYRITLVHTEAKAYQLVD